jgi:hypothetical protein
MNLSGTLITHRKMSTSAKEQTKVNSMPINVHRMRNLQGYQCNRSSQRKHLDTLSILANWGAKC